MALSLSEANCHSYGLGKPYSQLWEALGAFLSPNYLNFEPIQPTLLRIPITRHITPVNIGADLAVFFDFIVIFRP